MMAATEAKKPSNSVVIIEKNSGLARKIFATGNGRCNITNKFIDISRYHGGSPESIKSVIDQFDQRKTMDFFENLGLVLKEENLGRIFPRTDQASSVVDALTHEITSKKIDLKLDAAVSEIEKRFNIFEIKSQSNEIILAQKIIITAGGQAAAHLGTSGDAYTWIRKLGHKTTEIYPALSPLEAKESWIKAVQGLKVIANASVTVNGTIINQKVGDVLFTHFGLSGPAVMALAGSIGKYLPKDKVIVHLDLFHDESPKELDTKLAKIITVAGSKSIKNVIAGAIPKNLSPIILKLSNIDPERKSAEISKLDRQKIATTLKNIEIVTTGVRPFREAQVTHGGIDLAEINCQTMESKIVSGLFLAGEVLDVDGDSGGFNLQWAWSSGHLAGQSAANRRD